MACAAVKGLTARITRTELTTMSHAKSGMRNSVIPLQRRQNAVVMKLIAPPMEPKPLRIRASAQKSVLWPREKARSVSGAYANQPTSGEVPAPCSPVPPRKL